MTRLALAVAALACLCVQVLAQPWTERPYNPQIGSRWSIISQTDSEEVRPGGPPRDQHVRVRGEFSIDEKLPDGFRITYVNRELSITGTAPGTEMANVAFGAMKDIVIHARTDAAGKPIAVENLAEVKASMRIVVARMVEGFKQNPKVGEVVGQMMQGLLNVEGADAARTYIDNLTTLAAAQNAGLKPGAVARNEEKVANPFGGAPLRSTLITRLVSWDDATGSARISRRRDMDIDDLKAMSIAIARKLSAAAEDKITPQMIELMKQIDIRIESEELIDVRDGMAYAIEDTSTTTASVMGQTQRKVEVKRVSVVPLPK